MRRAVTVSALRARALTLCFGILFVAACTKETPTPPAAITSDEISSELKWARAALERNPELKVISVDAERNSIKVLVKASGETATVTPGELAAIPIGDLVALTHIAREPEPAPAPTVVEESIPATPAPQNETPAHERTADYTVEHQDGRMVITGPGMKIESASEATPGTDSMTQKHYDEPIICEGAQMMHLDNRRINVDGDAIIVRGGCELHLTNSQIRATGIGIVVKDATIHISNSTVQGNEAAFDAAPAARLHLQNSRFVGITRRNPHAKIDDQGGNSWR